MIASFVGRTCVTCTAALGAAGSHVNTAAEQREGGGGAKCAKENVQGAVSVQICLFFDATGPKWRLLNVEDESIHLTLLVSIQYLNQRWYPCYRCLVRSTHLNHQGALILLTAL